MSGILISLLFLFISLYIIGKAGVFKRSGFNIKFLRLVFIVKCMAGVLFLYIYDGRYEDRHKSDVYKFFDDSAVLSDLITSDPQLYAEVMMGIDMHSVEKKALFDKMDNWFRRYDEGYANDNHFMIRLNTFLRLFSFGEIHVHMILLNLLWMIGIMLLIKSFEPDLKQKVWMMGLMFLIPSLIFWHSVLLKEPLVLAGMGFLIYGLRYLNKKTIRVFIYAFLGVFLLINLKLFFGLVGLVVIILSLWFRRRKGFRSNLIKYSLGVILGILCLILVGATGSGQEKYQTLVTKQHDFKNLANGGTHLKNDTAYVYIPYEHREKLLFDHGRATFKQGSDFDYIRLPDKTDTIHVSNFKGTDTFSVLFDQEPSGSLVHIPDLSNGFLNAVPYALLNTFIQPVIFVYSGLFINLTAFENLLILCFIVFAFSKGSKYNLVNWNMFFAVCIFIVTIYMIIGLTTPVLGAIARYKSPLLPFVLYVCCLYVDNYKLEKNRYIKRTVLWLKSFLLQVPRQDSEKQSH